MPISMFEKFRQQIEKSFFLLIKNIFFVPLLTNNSQWVAGL